MTTLTYCKALPTPIDELNPLGKTQLEMFLSAYTPIFHKAVCETVNFMLSGVDFNKSKWRTHLQNNYGISARHSYGVISAAKGAVDSALECRILHIKTLEGKAKSCADWLKKAEKKLKNARKFYALKNWSDSKKGCVFPQSCSLKSRQTSWQNLRFQIHHKKRKLHRYQSQISALKLAPLKVSVPRNQALVVGCKNESFGNQVCQWDGNNLKLRVPACLESKFGKYVESKIGDFPRNINRLPANCAKTWHFYYKSGKWCAAVSFTPSEVKRVSRCVDYGCIGIDLNPGSIGWAYIDSEGNLKAHHQIPLQTGLPQGQQQAQIVKACLEFAKLASHYQCPIVGESLDFSAKKEQLRERGRKYARMLSHWAYSQFFKLLNSILSNRGIEFIRVNPAYSSIIGLVKYLKMYGLASDESAALVIARRGMRLSEKIPDSLTALVEVNSTKHVWSLWNQLNKKIKCSGMVTTRHCYYSISNWDFLVNLNTEEAVGAG
jgi:IS605 OrfB family transposase